MNEVFLENFLHVACQVTQADRSLVVDRDARVLRARNISPEEVNAEAFQDFAITNLKQAITSGEAIIANNVITDPSDAPTTNTNFANLRIAVAMPVGEHGAVYLDRHIRDGVIPRKAIDQLMLLVDYVIEHNQESASKADLMTIYEQMAGAKG